MTRPQLEWSKLLSSVRRKDLAGRRTKSDQLGAAGTRTEIERDYDRILFSAPIRRLADKTQVFPLDKNDSVRNRLTHSHEVSNLARSIGVALVHSDTGIPTDEKTRRDLPSMLAAIGLAHDVGNPPFGHQGEHAIGSWFREHKAERLDFSEDVEAGNIAEEDAKRMTSDYLDFEGNAQALRILTKLQILNDNFGLNVTCGTLGALMKYPVTSDKVDSGRAATKKFGCFHSEMSCCEQIWEETGLSEGVRHPLAYIMEACDDIAYSVLDAEDAVKKGLVSFVDVINFLEANCEGDAAVDRLLNGVTDDQGELQKKGAKAHHKKHREHDLSPAELNDISMQMFRVLAIGEMVTAVTAAFSENYDTIMSGTFEGDLISSSDAKQLCRGLKKCSLKHAFRHKSVLEIELKGHKIIHSLMDMMWSAIVMRGDPLKTKGFVDEADVFEKYVYNRISENYRRVFEAQDNTLPLGYKRCQLLGDMISGMTDSYAVDLEGELRSLKSIGM